MRESYRIERTTACGVELPADVFFDILLERSAADHCATDLQIDVTDDELVITPDHDRAAVVVQRNDVLVGATL
jgi:hypothetical protein